MKKTRKFDNEGFSLVELIIVIAIMAILTAVIGSQVIPYLEKSRVSKDKSTLDTVYTSFQTIAADYGFSGEDCTAYPTISAGYSLTNGNTTDAQAELQSLVGFDATSLQGKWGSKSAKSMSGATASGSTKTMTCSAGQCSMLFDPANQVIAVGVGKLVITNKG